MVEETIRVIRETESQADQIVKHARISIISFWKKPEKRRIRSEQSSFRVRSKKPSRRWKLRDPRRWRNERSQYSDRAGDQSVERKRAEKRSGGG